MNNRYLISYFVFFVATSDLGASEKVDHAAVLAPFLNDDTFLVAYLDVAALPAPGNLAELFQWLPKLPEESQKQLLGLSMANGLIKKFQDAGGQGVYLVAGLLDMHDEGGPVLIATAAPNKRPEKVEQMFHDLIHELRDPAQFANQRLAKILDARRHGDIVLVGTKDTINRYASLAASQRNDFIEPLTRLSGEGAVVAAVFAPGPDYRRIHRELWPTFPPPMTALKGELADRWRTFELAANLPPNANPRFMLQTTDPAAAQTFVDLYRALPDAADQFTELGPRRADLKRYLELILALAPPQIDGTHVTVSLSTADQQMTLLRTALTDATHAALESTRRRERMNQFKQLLLAMHNYADKNKHLPPAAICDKDGKPLLSWRVALLPYMSKEEAELYKQFHLDEPWDSPHNRTLIEKMPAVFADPDPKIRHAAGDGKTTFQVPVGPDTIFHNKVGSSFKEIADGTSKTIMLVEVEPLRAVVWTKPEDWEVDLQHPRNGLDRTDRDRFTAGFADAHVSFVTLEVKDDILRAMLTRAGREVFDLP